MKTAGLSVFVLAASWSIVQAGTINVPADQPTIQAGIDAAVSGVDEVVVAPGTYTGAGNKNLDFGGKLIIVRSANGPQGCIIDCENDGRGFYFHSGETADARVAGFTITNGSTSNGGGMYNSGSSPTVSNCTFSGNTANCSGGGMYIGESSSPIVDGCTFVGNVAPGCGNDSGGGGIYSDGGSPTVSNCTFTGNSTGRNGGGMNNSSSSPTVVNCTFSGNTAANRGGGMDNTGFNTRLVNAIFISNSARNGAGGMANGGRATLLNCIFMGNSAARGFAPIGGGIFNTLISSRLTLINCTIALNDAVFGSGGGLFTNSGKLTLSNCILWGNSDSGGNDETAQIHSEGIVAFVFVNNSCVQGWTGALGGTGNIGDDPLFFSGPGGDYYLSQIASAQVTDSPCLIWQR